LSGVMLMVRYFSIRIDQKLRGFVTNFAVSVKLL
jgi:hypothetical protein